MTSMESTSIRECYWRDRSPDCVLPVETNHRAADVDPDAVLLERDKVFFGSSGRVVDLQSHDIVNSVKYSPLTPSHPSAPHP